MTSEALPTAGADRLVVYLLGSGYGESQVVLFPGPEKRCMVVDSCLNDKGGENLTATLLAKLGVEKGQVDLFVLTHADEDHIGGAPRILDEFDPHRVWYSPFVDSWRSFFGVWRRENPPKKSKSRRLKLLPHEELVATVERLDIRCEESPPRARLAFVDTNGWERAPPGCSVVPIAPPASQESLLRRRLFQMFEQDENEKWIVSETGRGILDGSKVVGDHPNALSMALAIRWDRHRIVLGGDVEAPEWEKVLCKLKDLDRLDLVSNVDIFKVAHHGSENAFHGDAWAIHTKAKVDGATTVLVAPFNRKAKLPDGKALGKLKGHAHRLGITKDTGGSFERAARADWRKLGDEHVKWLPEMTSLVAVTLDRDGSQTLYASPDARFYRLPEPPSLMDRLLEHD